MDTTRTLPMKLAAVSFLILRGSVFPQLKASMVLPAAFLLGVSSPAAASPQGSAATTIQLPSPDWTKGLVIYEVAPKSFTSPNGPESGTFESLKARLPYLQELGITGIWLTGHSLSDPHHFFNIWMQYACLEPDKIDPSLGTPEQFKALIDEAHRRGIKIFLDVITHGVMRNSTLTQNHPEWFRGGTWGMVDYDWGGGHTDLDDWWVGIWTDYVTKYGVDGFRLDVDIYRPDLWARIRRNAAAGGHPIVIFEEINSVIPGVTDFTENETVIDSVLARDIPGFYDKKFGRSGEYEVEIQYADGSRAGGRTGDGGTLRVRLDGLTADRASRRIGDYTKGDGIPDVQLTVENVTGQVGNVTVTQPAGGDKAMEPVGAISQWSLLSPGTCCNQWDPELPWMNADGTGLPFLVNSRPLAMKGKVPTLQLYLPTLAYSSSILLSEHGWGFYAAKCSRADFGYSFLFTPMIPIFMCGEEFDATLHPIPWQSPDLFGGRNPGKGTMIYGSMLDWSELKEPAHRSMFEDVKRMLALRKQEAALLTRNCEVIQSRS